MKKSNVIQMLFMLLIGVSAVSCDKKDKEEEVSPNTSLLTAGTWQGSAIYIGGQELTEAEYELFGLDITEATIKFERNGSYLQTYEGQASPAGKWEFANNEQSILFDKGTSDEETVAVSKLDEDELFFSQDGYELRFSK